MKPANTDVYKLLFDHMLDGLAYCQMLYDPKGLPVDFIYIEVNNNFEELTGLQKVIGKKVTELIPGIKDSNPELFEIYGRVAMTGITEKFETYVKPLDIWFSISVYSPAKTFFVAVFQNITKHKQAEENLSDRIKDLEFLNKSMVGRELKMVELKKELEELKKSKK